MNAPKQQVASAPEDRLGSDRIPDRPTSAYEAAQSMRAIALTYKPEIGQVAEALCLVDVPVPRPGENDVAIRLCASSLNIDEVYAMQGTALGRFYGPKTATPDKPYLLGASVSGVVVGLGRNVEHISVGDNVIAIPSHHPERGSWAEYRCIEKSMVMIKPVAFTHVQAAAITMAACVAWGAIEFGRANRGDQCLVVGASGSIGIMIVQYLKVLGCHVTAVCSGRNDAFVRSKGAEEVVDYTAENFAEKALAKGKQYDVVFDCIGGRDIERDAFRVLKRSGVFETVVGPVRYIGERKLSWIEFAKVMGHILCRMATTRLRGPRYMFGEKFPKVTIQTALSTAVQNKIFMPVERVIPFGVAEVADAVRLLTTHRAKGRIVIDFSLRS